MTRIRHILPLAVLLISLTTISLVSVLALARAAVSATVAADGFSRVVVDGWGQAETGGVYALSGTRANFDVADGVGTIRVPNPNVTRTAILSNLSVQNVDLRTRVETDKTATGGGIDVDLVVRRVSAGVEYWFRAHIAADGSISARILRATSGRAVQLGNSVPVSGITHSPHHALWIRAQATDVHPTTLRMKIWQDGDPEPATWTYGFSDNTAALQAPGAVGLRVFVAKTSSNAPITFAFDELQADSLPDLDDPVLIGAGDIASCTSSGDQATASLLDGMRGAIFTIGDNAYPQGRKSDFNNCFKPTWGRHKARIRPVPGNHEYTTAGASGYFGYFGAAAGAADNGYYVYYLGSWHVIALNSAIAHDVTSPQYQWLAQYLASDDSTCSLAYWHHPRFSSGEHGNDVSMDAIWDLLYQQGVDVVVNGHDHSYERFAPMDDIDTLNEEHGIRSFVVGTGGESHDPLIAKQPNSEVWNGDTYGVLKLTLHESGYDWEFVPAAGKTFADAGSGSCH